MAEPAVVELFLKIERLENELKAAQRINLKVADLEAAIIQKDKEISQHVNAEKKLEQTIINLQQIVMNYKKALDSQSNDIETQTIELNNLKKEIHKYRNFLQKIVQPLTSLSEFNKDVLQTINNLLK